METEPARRTYSADQARVAAIWLLGASLLALVVTALMALWYFPLHALAAGVAAALALMAYGQGCKLVGWANGFDSGYTRDRPLP